MNQPPLALLSAVALSVLALGAAAQDKPRSLNDARNNIRSGSQPGIVIWEQNKTTPPPAAASAPAPAAPAPAAKPPAKADAPSATKSEAPAAKSQTPLAKAEPAAAKGEPVTAKAEPSAKAESEGSVLGRVLSTIRLNNPPSGKPMTSAKTLNTATGIPARTETPASAPR